MLKGNPELWTRSQSVEKKYSNFWLQVSLEGVDVASKI